MTEKQTLLQLMRLINRKANITMQIGIEEKVLECPSIKQRHAPPSRKGSVLYLHGYAQIGPEPDPQPLLSRLMRCIHEFTQLELMGLINRVIV